MKITIRTLSNKVFKMDIDPGKTVKELKQNVENDQGKEYPIGSQKLIYSGKILADETKLSDYNIDEKKFVVLMITKPPPQPSVAQSPASSTNTTTTTTDSKSHKKADETTTSSSSRFKTENERHKDPKNHPKAEPSSINPSSTTSTTTITTSTSTNPSSTTNANNQGSTQSGQLASGIVLSPQTAASIAARMRQNPNDRYSAPTRQSVAPQQQSPGESRNDRMARIVSRMNNPQFRQMQDLIQQSPHLLGPTLESLSVTDPELYNFLSENPDQFVSALGHPPAPVAPVPMSTIRPAAAHTAHQATQPVSGNSQQMRSEQLHIGVTQRDKEAIERLKELGFSEYLAVQAYMACDRDEQLAANLLFQMDQ